MSKRIKVTTRNRNLGYGWRNDTEEAQDWQGHLQLRIKRVKFPSVQGGLRCVEEAHALAAQLNSGGAFWDNALFLGGCRITGLVPGGEEGIDVLPPEPREFIRYLREDKALWVEVE